MTLDPDPDRHRLAGLRVLVTRPERQSQGLAAILRSRGAEPLCIPAIEIAAHSADPAMESAAAALGNGDVALFTSANAVAYGHALLPPRTGSYALGAVGAATARALGELGFKVDLAPRDAYHSEALLALEELAGERISGHRVVLFKGVGGRELLADELRARGARVTGVEVYRRSCPGPEQAARLCAARATVDAVVVTSGEALANLAEMLGAAHRDWLTRVPLVVASERIAVRAREHAIGAPLVVARQAADTALADALDGCRETRTGGAAAEMGG